MDYPTWVKTCAQLLEYAVVDATSATPTGVAAFDQNIAACIDYVENRLQRDLDFLNSIVSAVGAMTPNSRVLSLNTVDLVSAALIPLLLGKPVPAGTVVTTVIGHTDFNLQWINHGLIVGQQVAFLQPVIVGGLTLGGVFTITAVPDADDLTLVAPYQATSSASATVTAMGPYVVATQIAPVVNGDRLQPLELVTRDALDFFWPSENSPGADILPVQWCPVDQQTVFVGPAPDQAYNFEVVGTMRFPQMSSTNASNFLTQSVPDLYIQASMVYWWGALQQNAEQAKTSDDLYQGLLTSAQVEQTRIRYGNIFVSPSNPAGAPKG